MSFRNDQKRLFLRRLFVICLLGIMVLIGGCSTFNSNSNELINEVIIRNNTQDTLHNVKLKVLETNIILTTNYILPLRDYSLGFPARENERHSATLEWTHDKVRYKRNIKTIIPETLDKKVAGRVVIRIDNTGNIESIIESAN